MAIAGRLGNRFKLVQGAIFGGGRGDALASALTPQDGSLFTVNSPRPDSVWKLDDRRANRLSRVMQSTPALWLVTRPPGRRASTDASQRVLRSHWCAGGLHATVDHRSDSLLNSLIYRQCTANQAYELHPPTAPPRVRAWAHASTSSGLGRCPCASGLCVWSLSPIGTCRSMRQAGWVARSTDMVLGVFI